VTSTDRDLAYATDEIGAWAAETVDTEGLGGEHAAIAMDREGALHVVHVETGGVVRHAVRSGAEWAIETVPLPEAANDVSIAAADAVRLLWSGSDSGALHLASYESGWTDEIVDDTGVVRGVAIAVDADGALHALYHRAERCDAGAPCDRGDLVHASNASGTWHGEVADAEGATGFTPEAAFAPDGSVEVVYLRQDLPAILRAVGRAP
jgi:hypothetical protein